MKASGDKCINHSGSWTWHAHGSDEIALPCKRHATLVDVKRDIARSRGGLKNGCGGGVRALLMLVDWSWMRAASVHTSVHTTHLTVRELRADVVTGRDFRSSSDARPEGSTSGPQTSMRLGAVSGAVAKMPARQLLEGPGQASRGAMAVCGLGSRPGAGVRRRDTSAGWLVHLGCSDHGGARQRLEGGARCRPPPSTNL